MQVEAESVVDDQIAKALRIFATECALSRTCTLLEGMGAEYKAFCFNTSVGNLVMLKLRTGRMKRTSKQERESVGSQARKWVTCT